MLQWDAPYRGHPTNFHIRQLRVIRQLKQPIQRCSTTTVRTLQGGVTVNQIRSPCFKKKLLGDHGKVRRTVRGIFFFAAVSFVPRWRMHGGYLLSREAVYTKTVS